MNIKEIRPFKAISNNAGTVVGTVAGALVGGPAAVVMGSSADGYRSMSEAERRTLRRRNLFLGALGGAAIGGIAGRVRDTRTPSAEWDNAHNEAFRVAHAKERAERAKRSIEESAAESAAAAQISQAAQAAQNQVPTRKNQSLRTPGTMKVAEGLMERIKAFKPFAEGNEKTFGTAGGGIAGAGAGAIAGGLIGGFSGSGVLRGAAIGGGLGGAAGAAAGRFYGHRINDEALGRIRDIGYRHLQEKGGLHGFVPRSISDSAINTYAKGMTVGDFWHMLKSKREAAQ